MGALDQVKSFFTGDVNIDNHDIRQALKNAFPNLARAGSEFDESQYLSASYIQEKIVPELMMMDEARLQTFKSSIEKTSTDLHSLAKDVESSLRYKPRDGNAIPGNQQMPDRLKSSVKGVFKDAQNFLTEIGGLRTDAEKEQALIAEIIASANRSVVKFDSYVQRGDGRQYGDKANDLFEIDSWNTDIRKPTKSKEISHNVENVPKLSFVNVVNDVVAMAQEPSAKITVNGKSELVGSGTRLEKLAYLASWMSALEEGTDKVLPGLVAEAAKNTAQVAVDGTLGVVGDFAGEVWDEYPKTIIFTAALIGYAGYKSGNLLKGMVNAPGAGIRLLGKGASFIPVVNKLAPLIDKLGQGVQLFGDKLVAPGATSGTAGATPEEPRTPRRFVEVNPADLKDFKPGEANHEEYYKKTVEKIKSLGVAPTAPAISTAEVTRRTSLFMGLDKVYRGGKMSLAEYLKRTEDIIAGRGKIVVVDHAGVKDKSESVKNVKQRVMDRTPGLSQFTRNNPNGSAAASVSAMQEAKKRIKGASYESVDYAGAKVEFADATNRILFEEFRDRLQKYTEMQEWDAHNRGVIALEDQIKRIQTTDIPAKMAEINAKNAQIAAAPARVPGPSMTYPPPAGSPPGTPGTIIPGPEMVNPDITKFNSELGQLQVQLGKLNDKIAEINTKIAEKGADILPYRPKATPATGGTPAITPRQQFAIDTRALKLELSSAGAPASTPPGLIQRINTAVGAGTIPESAFDRAALKIDKVRLLEVVKTALKK